MKQRIKNGTWVLILFVFIATNMGCRKKKDTIVEVTVRNAASAPVANATVRLYPKPTPGYSGGSSLLWDYSANTDFSGIAVFNFNEVYKLGQAGVVVAHIDAHYAGSAGTGVVKVEQEEKTTTTVFI